MDPPDYSEVQATTSAATTNDSTNQQPTMIAKEEDEPMITTTEVVKPALLLVAQQEKHFMTGGTGSILKVKSQGQVDLSQSSLLAIEEARRYQQVEKGYKERKAKRAASGFSDHDDPASAATLTFSVTAENEQGSYAGSRGGRSSSSIIKSTSTAAAPPPSQVGEWEFTAPAKSDGCCVIS
jgi:hypothetical protein